MFVLMFVFVFVLVFVYIISLYNINYCGYNHFPFNNIYFIKEKNYKMLSIHLCIISQLYVFGHIILKPKIIFT